MSFNYLLESPANPTCPQGGLGKWLRRLKISHKLSLGYAIALGVAMVGPITGLVIGERYQVHAREVIEDVLEETQALHQLQTTLIEIQTRQLQLADFLSNPFLFQEEIVRLRESTDTFQQIWSELVSSYEEGEAEIEETSEETEAFQDLLETYPSTAGIYLQQVEAILQQIDSANQQPPQDDTAQPLLGDFEQRLQYLRLGDFMEEVEQMIEVIDEELEEAQDALTIASRLRLQVIIASMALSAAIAALLAIFSGRAITHPLQALTTVAQRVTQESDFTLRSNVMTQDEVGVLAASLNQLIEWVGVRTQALEQARDTLDQKVKERTQELSAIIDNLGDGLLVTNVAGQITWFNHSLLKMFPSATELMTGKSCRDVFPADVSGLVERNQTNPSQPFTAEVALTGGRIGQAVVSAIHQTDSIQLEQRCLGSVILIRDITAEKEVDRMKTDFISTVSHELRTPLTSVLGFAKLIQKKLEDVVLPQVNLEAKKTERAVKQVRQNIDIIVSEGERLTSLINDVLDVAKIEAGMIEWRMQPFSMVEVMEKAISATSVLAQNSQLEMIEDFDPDLPEIIGDRDRVLQVVINLISNALKFTDEGSVTCRVNRLDNEICVSVIDTGVGIAEADLHKVFEKFQQVGEIMTDKPKGTGLGLPICKQIVEHHNGRIWVESEPEQGSTFSFALPITLDPQVEIEKINVQTLVQRLKTDVGRVVNLEENSQKTILVVDDQPNIRNLLKQELEAEGYLVKEAKDGVEALEQVKSAPPDLIIMDVMMPSLNGFDLAAVLKNDPATMDIPTIILSIIEDRERGYRLGIDRYLTKPIDIEALLQNIEVLIAQKSSQKKVLVIDESAPVTKTLADVLLSKGYIVAEAANAQEGIEKALSIQPDMIIVDSDVSKQHDIVKTLRFDNGLENIFFILLEQEESGNIRTESLEPLGANV
ncbi:MAG: response regulator [Leptolyngbyaceae cyanobacterium MO_188.B28]|nr:response regulator [Leptolyngbyaceae cyanobacterium MO_188.B28]